ncbi:hypothetical protein HPB52_020949 [Rhipicephalus sanguineus]|uniref:Uncharacterized protein n=1 Tax=Rhipicephalus sanguineus TaxID=34632 RepID=A0A9D4PQA4_RHISA|nr:hypothetical protein HPB52_020949 [Rhipicephalus sanguineus]
MARPASSRFRDFGARSSLLSVPPEKFQPEFAAVVSIIVIAVAVVVLSAIAQMGRRGPLEQEVTAEGGGPFCCPEDMRETLRYINTSANPCRDFFAYVCSGVISYRLWPEDNTKAEFERMVFTGVMPPGVPRSPAGEFLIAYHRSCLESIVRRNISSELAVALVRREQGVLKNMDAKKAFIYAATATLKYRLNPAFYVLQQFNNPTVKVGTALICNNSHALDALKAVMRGVLTFESSIEKSPQRLFKICKQQVSSVWQLGRIFKVNIFTSPEKDAQLHVIFDNVKDAVRADLLKSALVAADDESRLEQFFSALTLFTLSETVDTGVPLPKVSDDFASSLLDALAFEHEASKAYFANFSETYTRSFVHLRINGNRSMYLTTQLYYVVQTGKANLVLSNMATVGRILAEALWFMVFRTVTWSPQTKANMLRFEDCYDSLYWMNSSGRNTDAITSFFTALGLSSVLNAFFRPQWLTVKPAWGFWRMSHSQLFYILSTYARCPRTSTARDVNIINAPLKFIKDFEDAFKCLPGAPMTKRHACSRPAL